MGARQRRGAQASPGFMGGVSVSSNAPALLEGVGTPRPLVYGGHFILNFKAMTHLPLNAAHAAAPSSSPATPEPSLHTLLRNLGILDNPALRAVAYDHNDIYGRGNGCNYMDGDILILDTSPVTSIIDGGEYLLRVLHFAGMNAAGGAAFLVYAERGEEYNVEWVIQEEHAAFFSDLQTRHPMAIVGRVVWVLQNVGITKQAGDAFLLPHSFLQPH